MTPRYKIEFLERLLNEGTEVSRSVDAIDPGNGLYRLLLAERYDPKDEVWEFIPGSTVWCETRRSDAGDYL